jgi:hypothetical protein
MPESGRILEQAKRLYDAAELNYRDVMLNVGSVLHKYVLEYLKENSFAQGESREKAIRQAATSLAVSLARIGALIRTAKVVELLAEKNEVGGLGWAAISRFGRFLVRGDKKRPGHVGWDFPREVGEQWSIRSGKEDEAKRLFQNAARVGLSDVKTRKFVLQGGPPQDNGAKGRERRETMTPKFSETLNSLKPMAKGSPRDVAEILFEIVKESDDPTAIIEHLLEMVRKIPSRRAS